MTAPTSKGNEPAWPSHGTMGEVCHEGLTKREYFAGLAFAAMNANPAFNRNTANERAKFAVVDADALLAALSAEAQP